MSWQRSGPARGVGFTLIELLVVVAIIATLIGILLPSLAAAQKAARLAACLSNVKQIATAGYSYAQEQGAYVGYAPGIDRKMLLYPYLKQGQSNADLAGQQVWNCPGNLKPTTQCGYGFNTNLNWASLSLIHSWGSTVALCDSGVRDGNIDTLSTMCNPPSKSGGSAYRPNARHADGAVAVGYVDSHADTQRMVEPFYPGPVGTWTGNGVMDRTDPNYKDALWDLY